jgi:multidrug resistance efflux pump
MSNPAPIPIPLKQRWREFRIQVLPALIFLAASAAAVVLWKDYAPAPSLLGQVETVTANISSPKSGVLANLHINRLQRVKAGDSIAEVVTTDPRLLQSSLAVILAEIKLLKVNLAPILGEQRLAISYDRLRLDAMQQRVELATARTRLHLAENDLRRVDEMYRQKIVAEAIYDQARTTRDRLVAEIEERNNLINEMRVTMENLHIRETGPDGTNNLPAQSIMEASIKVQEEKLRLTEVELSPVTLRSPIDGVISTVLRRSGETVMAGDPVATVTSLSSDRIIAYLRQPLANDLKPGMNVEVRARSNRRAAAEAKIIEVGTQMEPIKDFLLPPANTHIPELGLPILVNVPSTLKLFPGEIVDLRLLPDRN